MIGLIVEEMIVINGGDDWYNNGGNHYLDLPSQPLHLDSPLGPSLKDQHLHHQHAHLL